MIAQASPAAGPLGTDPSKRVNYTLGLVLGVDEFQQDQLYHAAARRGHDRLLHGYGTVTGLAVHPVPGADPEIRVEPGVAVDPCGREICVPARMCVKLTGWLDRHGDALDAIYGAGGTVPAAVILCHRECPDDTVPVPGEPCRSQEDAMAPSRIRDSFELKLALRDPPSGSPPVDLGGLTVFRHSQPEERAVRALGALLARVQTSTDAALTADGEALLVDAVLALAEMDDEEEMPASPPDPAADDPILLPADDAPRILRRAFRLWVTEVRPAIRALETPDVCGDAHGECCVLLAEIDLPRTTAGALDAGEPLETDEESRPYLLHTRLLQEWLVAGGGQEGRTDVDSFATVEMLGPRQVRVWLHHDRWLHLPADAVTVLVNDQPRGVASVPYGQIRNVWDVVLSGGELSDGTTVELRFDAEKVRFVEAPDGSDAGWTPADGVMLESVADEMRGPTGEYLDRYGWSLSAFAVYDRLQGGDLRGEYELPIVSGIQETPVSETPPTRDDEYLRFNGSEWAPSRLDEGRLDLRGIYPESTVVGLQGEPVSAADPENDHYLVYKQPGADGQWEPHPLPEGELDVDGVYPRLTVTGLQGSPVTSTATNGQFLRFVRPPAAPQGSWVGVTLAPEGDVGGTYPDLIVQGLRERPIAEQEPQEGEVLIFREEAGEWVPGLVEGGGGGAEGPAGGDLTGEYPDPTIAFLQDRLLDTSGRDDGRVLTYVGTPENGSWQAVDLPAAPPPPPAPPPAYQVVAAGQFQLGNREPVPLSVFNEMKLENAGTAGNNPLYQISVPEFDPERWTYIVTGTASRAVILIADLQRLVIELAPVASSNERTVIALQVGRFARTERAREPVVTEPTRPIPTDAIVTGRRIRPIR